jgi:hypothetical protein
MGRFLQTTTLLLKSQFLLLIAIRQNLILKDTKNNLLLNHFIQIEGYIF